MDLESLNNTFDGFSDGEIMSVFKGLKEKIKERKLTIVKSFLIKESPDMEGEIKNIKAISYNRSVNGFSSLSVRFNDEIDVRVTMKGVNTIHRMDVYDHVRKESVSGIGHGGNICKIIFRNLEPITRAKLFLFLENENLEMTLP